MRKHYWEVRTFQRNDFSNSSNDAGRCGLRRLYYQHDTKSKGQNAEYAVSDDSNKIFPICFPTMDDPYMRERSADVKDISAKTD